jgi:hypothetical protein
MLRGFLLTVYGLVSGEPSGGQVRRKAPPAMVWIRRGTFLMGTNDKESFLALKCTFSLPTVSAI